MKETELFEPVCSYLQQHGYSVNAEVKHCDITATKDDDLIIVELKTSANMQLVIQATDRQKITDTVYVAIPDPGRSRRFLGVCRVLRRLELGLLLVTDSRLGRSVKKVFDPLPYQNQKIGRKRRAIIEEIADRSANYNIGGSTRTKLITAYRENAIFVATCLENLGESSPKALRIYGTGEKTQSILASNHYGWFQRVDRGVYRLTEQGVHDLASFPELHERSQQLFTEKRQSLDSL
jgi:hypothetical protein